MEEISKEYEEIFRLAEKLGDEDDKKYPLGKHERIGDSRWKHLIGMIEMYGVRHGDPDQRLLMVDYLEKQLFRTPPSDGEVCHLTMDMWHEIKNALVTGEFRVLTEGK